MTNERGHICTVHVPLCYIFDQLPAEAGFEIDNSEFDQEKYEANPDRAKNIPSPSLQ
jgi:hypothetical protein